MFQFGSHFCKTNSEQNEIYARTKNIQYAHAMASLGWLSPGAVTEGVTPYFFLKKTGDLFSYHRLPVLRCHPNFFSPEKTEDLFLLITFIDFTRVSPPEVCHPAPFYLSDLVCPLFVVNLPRILFSFGGCHPGRSAPSPPPSDATVHMPYK